MIRQMNDTSNETLMMTIPQVAEALQCSDRHIANLRKRGQIPQPATVGMRNVRWLRRQILEWIENGCPAIAV
jgi:excisionase family DNA binding protein